MPVKTVKIATLLVYISRAYPLKKIVPLFE